MYWIILAVALLIMLKLVIIKPAVLKKRPNVNMFGYRIFYTDQRETNKNPNIIYNKLLYSEKYDISGKPDYIYKCVLNNNLVPVELKSGKVKNRNIPYEGDMYQLIAYFLLIEDIYGIKPKYGRLIYSDAMFIIQNKSSFRKDVIITLERMRAMLDTETEYVEPSFQKCKSCLCKLTVCEHSCISK